MSAKFGVNVTISAAAARPITVESTTPIGIAGYEEVLENGLHFYMTTAKALEALEAKYKAKKDASQAFKKGSIYRALKGIEDQAVNTQIIISNFAVEQSPTLRPASLAGSSTEDTSDHADKSSDFKGFSQKDITECKSAVTAFAKAKSRFGYSPAVVEFKDTQKPTFLEKVEHHDVTIKIVYDKDTRVVLGAQMVSREDMSMGIHMFSLAIQEKVTIDKLALTDLFFLPHFNKPYNYITMAALTAEK